jgi:hypothetical protein
MILTAGCGNDCDCEDDNENKGDGGDDDGGDTGTDGDSDTDTDSDSDTDTDTDSDTDTDTDTDVDSDTDTDTDTDADADGGLDGSVDGGADADTDVDDGKDCNYDYVDVSGTTVSHDDDDSSCGLEMRGFYATVPNDLYADGAACGRCVRVTNEANGKFVDAEIVNRCYGDQSEWCSDGSNNIGLNSEALAALGYVAPETDAGVVEDAGVSDEGLAVKWHYIPCEGEGF